MCNVFLTSSLGRQRPLLWLFFALAAYFLFNHFFVLSMTEAKMMTEAKSIDRLTARFIYRYVDELILERLADTSSAPPPTRNRRAQAAPCQAGKGKAQLLRKP
jgi:hypothetical protein